ncbi:hypothetical protein ALC57_02018, partial [Trachymyrmex cornetzi]
LTALATLAAPPIKDPSAPNIGKIGRIPPRFVTGSSLFLFVLFFSYPSFSRRITRRYTFACSFDENSIGNVTTGEIVTLRIGDIMFATRHV